MGIAEDLIIIIVVGLITGLIANKVRIPPIIGYILAGIVIGPFTGGITVSDIPRIELLAEIGVALLLFSIGLDFSFQELKSVKGIALIGTPIQVLILIFYGIFIGQFLDMKMEESIVLGMVISLSSTMVVIKTLMSRGLVGTLSSKVMIGVLIVQDLAAIPLMLIIPNLHSINNNIVPLLLTLLKASVILFLIIIIGVRVIPWILKFVAKLNSRELFLITITAIGLGVGYLTHMFGLSLAFGAFIAGMVINESDYSHQALNDIIPLRDIFGLVFFTSIGMLIDPAFISQNILLVLILVVLVLLGKFIIFTSLSLIFKYKRIIPLALGFGLAQIGEFSFVLARSGLQNKIINKEIFSLMLSVSVITMIISPFLSLLATPLYSLKRRWFKHESIETLNIPEKGLKNHIVIAGSGRVGFQIATIFQKIDFPFIIVEQDFRKFEKAKNAGFPVIFGDAGQETVLEATKIRKATLVIITTPYIYTVKEIISTALQHNPNVKIIARADDLSHVDALFEMNIFQVIQPEFEASLEMIRESLMLLDVPLAKIHGLTDDLRQENYSNLRLEDTAYSTLENFKKVPFLLDMSWFELTENSFIIGQTISSSGIRTKTGVSIVGILRNNSFIPNPNAEFIFQIGDYVAIIGLPENKKSFEELLSA